MTAPCLQFYIDDTEPSEEHPCECCGVTTPVHRLSCSIAGLATWWLKRRTLRLTPFQAELTEALTNLRLGDPLTLTHFAVLRAHGSRNTAASPILTTPDIAKRFGLSPKNSTLKFP